MEWCLFAVLARIELDTKERYKFFGCARQRACGIGSGPRRGHSVLRRCTAHSSRNDLARKRAIVAGMSDIPCDDDRVQEAADSLRRRGIHPYQLCSAITNAKHSIIRWPGRIYHGLFAYDVMHGLYINSIGYLQDTLLSALTAQKKIELDKRVLRFTSFRNPHDGSTSRKVDSLTSIGYMTAELRVLHLFIWSHAIGSKAEIFVEGIRDLVLSAVSSLQIICFAVRGKRPFTVEEHRYIFEFHGKRFFRCLDKLATWKRNKQIQAAENYNVGKPPAKRRRVPYWKEVVKDDDESDDTVSSSDPDSTSHCYARSDKIVPHGIMHFADQVIMGGTHNFHDVAAPEAAHKICVQLAGQRARVYGNVNQSTQSMLRYLMDISLFEKIVDVTLGMSGNVCRDAYVLLRMS